MPIVSTGIGSGLDIGGLVQQLVAAERAPVESRIARQEARTQSQLSAFGTLKSALAEFMDTLEAMKDMNDFLVRKASSGNKDLFTVSADSAAVPAAYSIDVQQLAQAQKLASSAFENADAVVGTGTLTIAAGATSFEIEITEENNTLAGIRDAINQAGDNAGVAATIVNAEAGSYLILTAEDTGSEHAITVTQAGGDGGLSALAYDPANGLAGLTETVAAQDARVLIDGLEVVSGSNTIAGAIDGISIDLADAAPGEPANLVVENDKAAVRKTIDGFVESWNALVGAFDKLTAFDAESGIAAPLQGDASVRAMRTQMRRELGMGVESLDLPFSMLSEIGIQTDVDGKLTVDDARLSEVLGTDFQQVGQLFANPTEGYATRLFGLVDGMLASDGMLETRTKGLNDHIDRLDDQRIVLDDRMAGLETRLLRKFNALDALVAQLSATSNYLTQQLANLPKISARDRD